MSTLKLTLKIKDVSDSSISRFHYKYYLKTTHSLQTAETFATTNLYRKNMHHTFSKPESLQTVEIWNQSKKKKIGTFTLQNLESTSDFEHTFKNSNIMVMIQRGRQVAVVDPKVYFQAMSVTGSITFTGTTSDDEEELFNYFTSQQP